jgi:hypothetical protein
VLMLSVILKLMYCAQNFTLKTVVVTRNILETGASTYRHLSQQGGCAQVSYNVLYMMWRVTMLCTVIQDDSL